MPRCDWSIRLISCVLAASVAVPAAAPAAAAEAEAQPQLQSTGRLSLPVTRVGGADRFATAVAMAQQAYPGWSGITDVVVASGDDSGLVDSLSASSLCWAYDAPLLLMSKNQMPNATRAALTEIVSANTTVTVHVVGGVAAVPAARVDEVWAIVAAGGAGSVEQPWTGGDRYSTAASVAERARAVAAEKGKSVPDAAFIANGAESARFCDALVASAVSRSIGIPVLLARQNAVPPATQSALVAAGFPEVIVVGGPAAVGADVYSALAASSAASSRWEGANRYLTGVAVAKNAIARGWSDGSVVALASSVPDGLSGASWMGSIKGLVLPTDKVRLPRGIFDYLMYPAVPVSQCVVLGSSAAIVDDEYRELQGHPGRPTISTPNVKWVGATVAVSGNVNSNTTAVELYMGGNRVGSVAVSPYGAYSFNSVSTPSGGSTIEVRAVNPEGGSCAVSTHIERLIYPYPTCIVVDKSDFRLYWVKDNRLAASYPVATGRRGMETPVGTWKILAKYYTDPRGVYGPRKMRLYRQSGSNYVHTNYLIHGTNEPWVIGTKASHGCIRMYNADVLKLFPEVPLGTMVVTRE